MSAAVTGSDGFGRFYTTFIYVAHEGVLKKGQNPSLPVTDRMFSIGITARGAPCKTQP